ncbi:Hint domain-containing protein [Sphaerisporangium sp. B11E5]|uniref:Hint domain-containing protein n=1 Tax=Sphaerisporangium sp. B11E5 TaxID=3153563 RepID=UPI00325DCB60
MPYAKNALISAAAPPLIRVMGQLSAPRSTTDESVDHRHPPARPAHHRPHNPLRRRHPTPTPNKSCQGSKCNKTRSEKETDKIGQFCKKRSNAKKPQCAGNANHEYGGNKPKKSKPQEHDVNNLPDLCKTSACRNAVTPISPKSKFRDVLDELEDLVDLAPSPDEVIDQLTDDAAPDLPPSIPPGMDGGSCLPNSFVAGTPVLMADGTHKPIEQIRVGDLVRAADPLSGHTAARPVVTLISGEGTKTLVELTIDLDGPHGTTTDQITATDAHPFWLPQLRRWLPASAIQPGTWLQTSAGTWVQVTAVRTRTVQQHVYNLTVSGLHTYFVGAGTHAILTHNDGPGLPDGHLELDADRGDRMFPTERQARREMFRRFRIPTSRANNYTRNPQYGNNSNLTGPNGEPWEMIEAKDVNNGDVVIQHHSNGHVFKDVNPNQWSRPHYHGPAGEHGYYGDSMCYD